MLFVEFCIVYVVHVVVIYYVQSTLMRDFAYISYLYEPFSRRQTNANTNLGPSWTVDVIGISHSTNDLRCTSERIQRYLVKPFTTHSVFSRSWPKCSCILIRGVRSPCLCFPPVVQVLWRRWTCPRRIQSKWKPRNGFWFSISMENPKTGIWGWRKRNLGHLNGEVL